MQKDKLSKNRDSIWKKRKIVIPVIVVVVAAFTVTIVLNRNREKNPDESSPEAGTGNGTIGDISVPGEEDPEEEEPEEEAIGSENISLLKNQDEEVANLVLAYYNARESGDENVLIALYDMITASELLYYVEWAKYIDHYSDLCIYTKQGQAADSVVVYVYYKASFVNHEEAVPGYENMYICRNDQGLLYIKNRANFTEDENEYIITLNKQDDAAEFYNRVTVEYNDLLLENVGISKYLEEVTQVVREGTGLTPASMNIAGGEGGLDETDAEQEGEGGEPAGTEEFVPAYAIATTTVNVRSSDSEQADRLGSVTAGTRLQVQEVRVNGWTKVTYEGADGFIKSDYLEYAGSDSGQEAIGTVTATTRVNVRSAASQTSDILGTLSGGETLDLLAVEGEWCKVIFAGNAGYVKAEFVRQN